MSRHKKDAQGRLEFQPSNLKLTNEYFAKYEAISSTLDQHPTLLDLIHQDIKDVLSAERSNAQRRGQSFKYTSDNLLRVFMSQVIEGESLRGIVIRVDDSHYLRRFTRIYDGPMMDFTTLCKLRNAIRQETWKQVNQSLARAAVREQVLCGDELRLDTTVVETNIHFPTDGSLLWDGYRVLARLVDAAREIDGEAVGERRIHRRRVKRYHTKIARKAVSARKGGKKDRLDPALKDLYFSLIQAVEGICQWSESVSETLVQGMRKGRYGPLDHAMAEQIVEQIRHYIPLARRVTWQASERVLEGRPVANENKLFSLFEPHTELLIRGKAGKNVEFGHMIQIQQVRGKFITDYEVFEKKPFEPALLNPVLDNHKKLFGSYPDRLAADKGYWPGKEEIGTLEKKVELVAIAQKGRRDDAGKERETDPVFRHAQRFRAGVEGTISFLKRVLRLSRCFNKGWNHYVSTVGASIFAHNLLILARC